LLPKEPRLVQLVHIYGTAADGKNMDQSYLFLSSPWNQGNYSRYKLMVKLLLMMLKLMMTNLINPISSCAAQGAKASTPDFFGTAAATAADGKNLEQPKVQIQVEGPIL
jgi:hypothetical protein